MQQLDITTEVWISAVSIVFGLIYWRTRFGPLVVAILVLIEIEAVLLGVRVEFWRAMRRCWRHHRFRVAQVRRELGATI